MQCYIYTGSISHARGVYIYVTCECMQFHGHHTGATSITPSFMVLAGLLNIHHTNKAAAGAESSYRIFLDGHCTIAVFIFTNELMN